MSTAARLPAATAATVAAVAPHDNVEIVRAMYAAFERRDVEGALRHVHPDAEFRPFATAQLAGQDEPYRGHDGIRRYFADVGELWDEFTLEALDYRAAGTSVVVFGRVRAMGPAAEVDADATWVWKLRDGLAVEGRVFSTGGDALRWPAERRRAKP